VRPEHRAVELLYRFRLLWLGLAVTAVFLILAPGDFATPTNLGNIVRATTTDAFAAAGFTIVMITGQLDLSVGAVMGLGAVAVIFLQPALGWLGAVLAAALAGALVGFANGLLVSRAKVNSFIVTLGTLTILQGVCRAFLQGGSKSLTDVTAGMHMVDLLNPVLPWSPRIVVVVAVLVLLELALRRTRSGANLYLLGANRETAWHAGVPVDRLVTGAFILSGILAALGGALTAMAQNTVMPNLGDKTLMLVVAAVIAGGTSMAGGRGSVALSVAALLLLNGLTNGLSLLGASKSVKLVAQGLILAAIIVYDAWRQARRERVRGQRKELLAELVSRPEPTYEDLDEQDEQGSATMQPRQPDRTFAMVCVTAMACVAIVAIYAIWAHGPKTTTAPGPSARPATGASPTKAAPAGADVTQLKATDGQPLVWIDDQPLNAPKRPANPEALPDDDLLRWYDSEFSGWNAKKLPQPASPANGPEGKRIVALQYMDHPYWQGFSNGMKRQAQMYGIKLTIMEAGNDNKVQMDQVAQAIGMKPDMVIITPVDANGVVPMLKRLYDAKMPTIASNLLPVDEGMKYVLCWTGPDDWGQFRMLAREFAKAMHNEGAYVVVRHVAGTSCYLSRTWGAVSELKKIAPKMTCLDMQTTDLQSEKTKTQVAVWLKKYGSKLKGIVSADDSKAMVGIVEALKDAGRSDVVIVSAGASRTGLNYIKDGKVYAVTYQSAEADGALPIEMAARWFRGEQIKRPVYYLQKHIITAADVDQYMPAQW
jgi:ribose/xylose/arabinose/galactoside ABC-type transport system permease subunit/ABC-type sugar transport system substrate-binding protein